ncbi:MAG: zinc ribbon domain-containing protein [Proteobacteria bacterium]|nr:zinc ribbon domain-containing protein [Pseudomonadota bacterium]
MPIYEYQCRACGHELEALQKMADDALVYCPECHGETLKKKISAVGFQLKGTGWYETDFKNSGAQPASKTASTSSDGKQSEKPAGESKSGKSDAGKNKSKVGASSQAA